MEEHILICDDSLEGILLFAAGEFFFILFKPVCVIFFFPNHPRPILKVQPLEEICHFEILVERATETPFVSI